jgi:hypothetical protein
MKNQVDGSRVNIAIEFKVCPIYMLWYNPESWILKYNRLSVNVNTLPNHVKSVFLISLFSILYYSLLLCTVQTNILSKIKYWIQTLTL